MASDSPETLLETQPDRDTLRSFARAMPIAEGDGVLDDAHAAVVMHDVGAINPVLRDHFQRQLDAVVEEVELRLEPGAEEDTFVVTRHQLRGALARAMIRGAAQITADIGEPMHFDNALRQLFALEDGSSA